MMCTLGVSLSLALGWSEESWVEARSKASVAYAKGSKGYTLTATLSSKRHSESDATIQVSMVGADGTQTEWETLGSGWTTAMMGKERKVEIRFQSVGSPAQLLLKTDSSDGTLFESVTVEASGVDKVRALLPVAVAWRTTPLARGSAQCALGVLRYQWHQRQMPLQWLVRVRGQQV